MCAGTLWAYFQKSLQFLHRDSLGCVKGVRGVLEDATVNQLRPTWDSIWAMVTVPQMEGVGGSMYNMRETGALLMAWAHRDQEVGRTVFYLGLQVEQWCHVKRWGKKWGEMGFGKKSTVLSRVN